MRFSELFTPKQFVTRLGALRFGKGLFDDETQRTPHEEMEQATKAYLTRPQVNSGIEQIALFILGNDVGVSSKDPRTVEFLKKWLSQRPEHKKQLHQFLISALVTGNGYLEFSYRPMTDGSLILDNFFPITDSARVYRNLVSNNEDDWWIYEVPTELKTYPFSDLRGELVQMRPKFWFINYVMASSTIFRRSVYGIAIHKSKIRHFKWGWSRDMIYGRSFTASIIDDTQIVNEIVKNWSIISRYRALNSKIISVGDEANPATPEDINNLTQDLQQKRDSEHIIINKPHQIDTLSNVGEYDDMSAPIDWLRRDVTSGLVPNYLTPWNSDVNRATSEEVRVVFEYKLQSLRDDIINYLNKEIIGELRLRYPWIAEDASFIFGAIDFETRSEKMNTAMSLYDRGVITVNELRQVAGMPPIPTGGTGKDGQAITGTPEGGSTQTTAPTPELQTQSAPVAPAGGSSFRYSIEGSHKEAKEPHESPASPEDELSQRINETADEEFDKLVEKFFSQFDKSRIQIEKIGANPKVIQKLDETMSQFDTTISALTQTAFDEVMAHILKPDTRGGMDTHVNDAALEKKLRQKADLMMQNFEAQLKVFNQKKLQEVRSVVTAGIAANKTHAQIKSEVKDVINKYKKAANPQDYEIERIIRTEIGKSTNLLRLIKWQEQGFSKFQWVTMNDAKVRELHKKRNMKVYDISTALTGKAPLTEDSYPGSAVNCRCTAILAVE